MPVWTYDDYTCIHVPRILSSKSQKNTDDYTCMVKFNFKPEKLKRPQKSPDDCICTPLFSNLWSWIPEKYRWLYLYKRNEKTVEQCFLFLWWLHMHGIDPNTVEENPLKSWWLYQYTLIFQSVKLNSIKVMMTIPVYTKLCLWILMTRKVLMTRSVKHV